ncbi:MAG: Hpt domain-containing protein [Candidatus Neomarinimicrobiota bacterium]
MAPWFGDKPDLTKHAEPTGSGSGGPAEDLRRYYRQSLVAWIAELESAGASLLAREPGAVETVQQIAHILKGSGGTFGFPEITTAAKALQKAKQEDLSASLEALLAILRSVVASEAER